MAMRGSEKPQIELRLRSKQATGPKDNLVVLITSLAILTARAVRRGEGGERAAVIMADFRLDLNADRSQGDRIEGQC